MEQFDAVIVGAGAAGMMCAIECARRSRRVLVLDHNHSAGEKIRNYVANVAAHRIAPVEMIFRKPG